MTERQPAPSLGQLRASAEQFGGARLVDRVVHSTAAGAPEALRRLVRAILDHHNGLLRDDATILLAEWHPHRTPDS